MCALAIREHRILPRRRKRKQTAEQADERPTTLIELREIAKKEPWVLAGTYYVDTGEAPASKAVFGDPKDAEACSEILRHDMGDVKAMWENVTDDDASAIGAAYVEGSRILDERVEHIKNPPT